MKKLLLSLLYAVLTILGTVVFTFGISVAAIHYPILLLACLILFPIGIVWVVIYYSME